MRTPDVDRSIATTGSTMEILKKNGLKLKKSLGQNFLADKNIMHKIVNVAEIDEQTGVIEIGPGVGALTQELATKAKQLVALEIDGRLIPILKNLFSESAHVHILHEDVLKVNLRELLEKYFTAVKSIKLVANLPYYITTPIIMKLLESRLPIDQMVVMVQKEVGERMTSSPGSKNYGSLSVAVQYYCHAKIAFAVPSSVFVPKPKVDSSVLHLTRRKTPPIALESEAFFFSMVKACFAQRRKTLYNNLAASFFDDQNKEKLRPLLESCNIDPSRRAETLTMMEFGLLSNKLYSDISSI